MLIDRKVLILMISVSLVALSTTFYFLSSEHLTVEFLKSKKLIESQYSEHTVFFFNLRFIPFIKLCKGSSYEYSVDNVQRIDETIEWAHVRIICHQLRKYPM